MNENISQRVKEDIAVTDTLAAQLCDREGTEYIPARYDELACGDDEESARYTPRSPGKSRIARYFRNLFLTKNHFWGRK